ncbi:hypothetical protein [Enterococcus sp. N249-2]
MLRDLSKLTLEQLNFELYALEDKKVRIENKINHLNKAVEEKKRTKS